MADIARDAVLRVHKTLTDANARLSIFFDVAADGMPLPPRDAARLLLEILAEHSPETLAALERSLSEWTEGGDVSYERLVGFIHSHTGDQHDEKRYRRTPKQKVSLAALLGSAK